MLNLHSEPTLSWYGLSLSVFLSLMSTKLNVCKVFVLEDYSFILSNQVLTCFVHNTFFVVHRYYFL